MSVEERKFLMIEKLISLKKVNEIDQVDALLNSLLQDNKNDYLSHAKNIINERSNVLKKLAQ